MRPLGGEVFSSHAAGILRRGAFVVGTSLPLRTPEPSSAYQPRAFM